MARYCLDGAVSAFGNVVESSLWERKEITLGGKSKSVARYTLKQLLDPAFTLPRENEAEIPARIQGAEGLYFDEVS